MPEYLSPGVYVEEVASGPRPIEGVGTSTAAMVGQTERGPETPRLVTSWGDYARWYGGIIDSKISFLPFAVRGYFDNGGQRLFIARVTPPNADVAQRNHSTTDAAQNLVIKANGPGAWGNRLFIRISDGRRRGFRLTILYYRTAPPSPFVDPTDAKNVTEQDRREPDVREDFDDLGFDPEGPSFVLTRVNGSSQLIHLEWSAPTVDPARPDNTEDANPFVQLDGLVGTDGDPITDEQYTGDPGDPVDKRLGLAGLAAIDEVNMLCVPDEVHPSLATPIRFEIRSQTIIQCETLKDRFAILQTNTDEGNVTDIPNPQDTTYAAIYYPWIRVFDPRTQDTLLIPPGGHIAGIYARTDIERGVHKAPANAVVRGIINRDINGSRKPLEFLITKGEHDILNPRGINVIRDFRPDGRGIRVWGARTASSDPLWKYVNVRRLFLFIEESIDEGTQWVVFEPNYEATWARVRQSVTNFLTSVWRSGALQGLTTDEAFFVKCDRTTMTQDDIDNGRLICEVGVAPAKPAEFVIFKIQQKTIDF